MSRRFISRHLAAGSEEPVVKPDRFTIYNMRFCPYAERVMYVALAKGIDFDCININLTSKPEWYFSKNPLGLVPAIEKGDFTAIESMPIMEYLDEKFPEPKLAAATPEEKAEDASLLAQYTKMVTSHYYRGVMGKDEETRKEGRQNLLSGLEWLEGQLAKRRHGGPFFNGSRVGLIDYALYPWFVKFDVLREAGMLDVPLEKHKLLLAWTAAMRADPAVVAYVPPAKVIEEYIRRGQAGNHVNKYDIMLEE